MPELKKQSKVLLDASCLMAAVLSPTGGSFALINEGNKGKFQLCFSEYILKETALALKEKYPQNLVVFNALIEEINYKILPEANPKEVEKAMQYIDFKDAPILITAIKEKVDFLVTLDRKDFLGNPKLKKLKLPFKILTPGSFLANLRNGS